MNKIIYTYKLKRKEHIAYGEELLCVPVCDKKYVKMLDELLLLRSKIKLKR